MMVQPQPFPCVWSLAPSEMLDVCPWGLCGPRGPCGVGAGRGSRNIETRPRGSVPLPSRDGASCENGAGEIGGRSWLWSICVVVTLRFKPDGLWGSVGATIRGRESSAGWSSSRPSGGLGLGLGVGVGALTHFTAFPSLSHSTARSPSCADSTFSRFATAGSRTSSQSMLSGGT